MNEIDKALETRGNLEMALHLVRVEIREFPNDVQLTAVEAALEKLANKAEARYLDVLVRKMSRTMQTRVGDRGRRRGSGAGRRRGRRSRPRFRLRWRRGAGGRGGRDLGGAAHNRQSARGAAFRLSYVLGPGARLERREELALPRPVICSRNVGQPSSVILLPLFALRQRPSSSSKSARVAAIASGMPLIVFDRRVVDEPPTRSPGLNTETPLEAIQSGPWTDAHVAERRRMHVRRDRL